MPSYPMIDSNKFTYINTTRTFVTDMSMLHDEAYGRSLATFYIRSARTGDTRLFINTGVDYDASGEDIVGYRFISPGNGLSALLIND